MLAPRKYDPEAVRRAVELVTSSGRPVAHIARELGTGGTGLSSKIKPREPRLHVPRELTSDMPPGAVLVRQVTEPFVVVAALTLL